MVLQIPGIVIHYCSSLCLSESCSIFYFSIVQCLLFRFLTKNILFDYMNIVLVPKISDWRN